MDAIYYLLIIGLGAFCLVLALGLIVAARQRPSRHDLTLERIKKLEKELGMGGGESGNLKDAAELSQVDAERTTDSATRQPAVGLAKEQRAAPHRVGSDGDAAQ